MAPLKQAARIPEPPATPPLGDLTPAAQVTYKTQDAHEDTGPATAPRMAGPTHVHLSGAAPRALRPQTHLSTISVRGLGKALEFRQTSK